MAGKNQKRPNQGRSVNKITTKTTMTRALTLRESEIVKEGVTTGRSARRCVGKLNVIGFA